MSAKHTRTDGRSANHAKRNVLISGASFAGLSTAFWMIRLGYAVTIVEIANSVRKGGTPVDIRESVVDVVNRMGLLEQIASSSLPARPMEFLNADGTPAAPLSHWGQTEEDTLASPKEYEIERDVLLEMLFEEVQSDVEFLFNDSIALIKESKDEVTVTFESGNQRSFSLLFGCDGTHSAVRRMWFGEESQYLLSLKNYFSLTIVDKLLIEENTSQMYNVPGKVIMLNAYNNKTDIAFGFFSEQELSYNRRDLDQQRNIILKEFHEEGWRTPELLAEMNGCSNFYFDKLCQIRMQSWTKGRIALVGDAGYCPSPAAGMGGSLAIVGAAALADALEKYPDDFKRAFEEYDASLRPLVTEIQTNAIDIGLEMFAPRTEEALQKRNAQLQR